MKHKIIDFCKKEVVLVAASILAVLSACIVPPSAVYITYIDWRVLGILFTLMVIMAGLQKSGWFDALGDALLARTKTVWQLVVVLVMLCFFLSMVITNDVALITFVPFAVIALEKSNRQNLLISVIILQTIAANLGSMLTPIGNPQNLYLYHLSGMNLGEFLWLMLPYAGIAFGLLMLGTMLIKGKKEAVIVPASRSRVPKSAKLLLYLVLFVLAFLVVLKVLPYEIVLGITVLSVLLAERSVFKEVDYCLLLTFVSFFLFTGNMGNLPAVKEVLQQLVEGREVLTAVLTSQVISNVPAALLLSGFTEDYQALLVGVNIGGLGTLIASMASLISYKIFANRYHSQKGRYFLWFTLANVVCLLILYMASHLL